MESWNNAGNVLRGQYDDASRNVFGQPNPNISNNNPYGPPQNNFGNQPYGNPPYTNQTYGNPPNNQYGNPYVNPPPYNQNGNNSYNNMPPPPPFIPFNQQPVIILNQADQKGKLPNNANFSKMPIKICCPACKNVGITRMEHQIGRCSIFLCIFTFPIGLLALCCQCSKDKCHYCSLCRAPVGTCNAC